MIFGIGVDIVQIARIQRVWMRHGDAFTRRILSFTEQNDFKHVKEHLKPQWLAKRWAAKEALAKATGLGMRTPVQWEHMSIRHTEQGQPVWSFTDALAAWIEEHQLQSHLSLSDESESVIAYVILEKKC